LSENKHGFFGRNRWDAELVNNSFPEEGRREKTSSVEKKKHMKDRKLVFC
jgi:hypothetical protein